MNGANLVDLIGNYVEVILRDSKEVQQHTGIVVNIYPGGFIELGYLSDLGWADPTPGVYMINLRMVDRIISVKEGVSYNVNPDEFTDIPDNFMPKLVGRDVTVSLRDSDDVGGLYAGADNDNTIRFLISLDGEDYTEIAKVNVADIATIFEYDHNSDRYLPDEPLLDVLLALGAPVEKAS